jgi:hypothetical protein
VASFPNLGKLKVSILEFRGIIDEIKRSNPVLRIPTFRTRSFQDCTEALHALEKAGFDTADAFKRAGLDVSAHQPDTQSSRTPDAQQRSRGQTRIVDVLGSSFQRGGGTYTPYFKEEETENDDDVHSINDTPARSDGKSRTTKKEFAASQEKHEFSDDESPEFRTGASFAALSDKQQRRLRAAFGAGVSKLRIVDDELIADYQGKAWVLGDAIVVEFGGLFLRFNEYPGAMVQVTCSTAHEYKRVVETIEATTHQELPMMRPSEQSGVQLLLPAQEALEAALRNAFAAGKVDKVYLNRSIDRFVERVVKDAQFFCTQDRALISGSNTFERVTQSFNQRMLNPVLVSVLGTQNSATAIAVAATATECLQVHVYKDKKLTFWKLEETKLKKALDRFGVSSAETVWWASQVRGSGILICTTGRKERWLKRRSKLNTFLSARCPCSFCGRGQRTCKPERSKPWPDSSTFNNKIKSPGTCPLLSSDSADYISIFPPARPLSWKAQHVRFLRMLRTSLLATRPKP